MSQVAKRRFDAIAELYKVPWERLNSRRTYEVQASFTLWTALGGFIVLLWAKEITITCWTLRGGMVFCGVLTFLHGYWLHGIGKRHEADRVMAFHYQSILHLLSGSGFNRKLRGELEGIQKKQKGWRDWARQCQLAVTLILAGAAAGLLMIKYQEIPSFPHSMQAKRGARYEIGKFETETKIFVRVGMKPFDEGDCIELVNEQGTVRYSWESTSGFENNGSIWIGLWSGRAILRYGGSEDTKQISYEIKTSP